MAIVTSIPAHDCARHPGIDCHIGASIKLGTTLRVRDERYMADECADRSKCGKRGKVVGFIVDDNGARPWDPMYVLRFADGSTDNFWLGEVE